MFAQINRLDKLAYGGIRDQGVRDKLRVNDLMNQLKMKNYRGVPSSLVTKLVYYGSEWRLKK
jgi:hypothetical protein